MGIVVDIEWPNAGLSDRDISNAAQIDGSKIIRQQANSVEVYSQGTSVASDVTQTILMVYGKVGTLIALEASIFEAGADPSTVEIELKKGSAEVDFTSVLSGPLSITHSTAERTPVSLTSTSTPSISTTALVAGDILQIVVDTSDKGATPPKGLLVTLTYQEAGKSA